MHKIKVMFFFNFDSYNLLFMMCYQEKLREFEQYKKSNALWAFLATLCELTVSMLKGPTSKERVKT